MNTSFIPFNKPYFTGKETAYIKEAVETGKISGNGKFTKMCQHFFEENYGFKKTLLTTSCTDALEMAAILLDIKEGDEVIMPTFTFVSTANAFVLRGAKIVFIDSLPHHPNMNTSLIKESVTKKTKAIVVVHYGGIACDMEQVMLVAKEFNLWVVEDAAQAIDSYYISKDGNKKALGTIGHLAAFSFHETKNIMAGEGGMLAINDERFVNRAEIIWEKGTNRLAFFRGEVDKYNWVDIGSSFLPSEITAAFLWAQLENLKSIQQRRIEHCNAYFNQLQSWAMQNDIQLPEYPVYSTNNGNVFYLLCKNKQQRNQLIAYLKSKGIVAVFHYICLHTSEFYLKSNPFQQFTNAQRFSDSLLRLPLYFELHTSEVIDVLLKWDDENAI
jgi:dTDP-4-amino-4,6-dideoxygalactose transaminase